MNIAFLDGDELQERYQGRLRGGSDLHAAVEAPRWRYTYNGEERLHVLAAAIMCAVAHAHPLVDGNKRASIELADEFLILNGTCMMAHEWELVWLAVDAASGVHESEIAERMESVIRPRARPFAERYPRVLEILADR